MNNWKILQDLITWNEKDRVYWINIIQRGKDRELRTEQELYEAEDYCQKMKSIYEKPLWMHHIIAIPVSTAEELERNKDFVIKMCNAFGARAYLSLNPSYYTETYTALLESGLTRLRAEGFVSDRMSEGKKEAKTYYSGKYGLTLQGDFKESKDWWYEVDCDLGGGPEGKYVGQEFLDKVKEAEEDVKEFYHPTRMCRVPSKTGFHILFQLSKTPKDFSKWEKKYPDVDDFHINRWARPILYMPKHQYYLTTKKPAV